MTVVGRSPVLAGPAPGGGGGEVISGPAPTPQGAWVEREANQNIPNATETLITFDTEVRDDDDYWAAGDPTKLVAQREGWHYIAFAVQWNTYAAISRAYMKARLNNTTDYAFHQDNAQGVLRQKACATIYMSANDYLQLIVWHNSGSRAVEEAWGQIIRICGGIP